MKALGVLLPTTQKKVAFSYQENLHASPKHNRRLQSISAYVATPTYLTFLFTHISISVLVLILVS
jgi:hypothetical protein